MITFQILQGAIQEKRKSFKPPERAVQASFKANDVAAIFTLYSLGNADAMLKQINSGYGHPALLAQDWKKKSKTVLGWQKIDRYQRNVGGDGH